MTIDQCVCVCVYVGNNSYCTLCFVITYLKCSLVISPFEPKYLLMYTIAVVITLNNRPNPTTTTQPTHCGKAVVIFHCIEKQRKKEVEDHGWMKNWNRKKYRISRNKQERLFTLTYVLLPLESNWFVPRIV